MIFTETKLNGSFVIEPKKFEDERGFFARSWCQQEFEAHGLTPCVVQANISYNPKHGTLRGMHYQVAPHSETKIVRCTRGALYDVIVDVRPESPTYKQWIGVELTADNYKALYVPAGFAHGFVTLTDETEATYMVSEFYTPGAERGLRYNDPAFAIQWPLAVQVISQKDKNWGDFIDSAAASREAASMKPARRMQSNGHREQTREPMRAHMPEHQTENRTEHRTEHKVEQS